MAYGPNGTRNRLTQMIGQRTLLDAHARRLNKMAAVLCRTTRRPISGALGRALRSVTGSRVRAAWIQHLVLRQRNRERSAYRFVSCLTTQEDSPFLLIGQACHFK